MAFKRSKKKQTDYNIGGKAISDTAIPLYQKNLTRMDDYLSDPTARQDEYMNKYFSTDNAQNSDFLRNYQRAMANVTGNNYSATSGGYSSSGQRAYDDNQRYWNDLGSRLQGNNVSTAYSMANQDYQNMLGANSSYQNAYGLGKAYSDVDQYNDLVDQSNKNWYSNVMSTIGQGLSAIPDPLTSTIGAALQIGGNFTSNNAGDLVDSMSGLGENNRATAGGTSSLGNAFQTGFERIGTLVNDWKSGNKKYYPKWAGGKGIQANKVNSGGSLFSNNDPWTARIGG